MPKILLKLSLSVALTLLACTAWFAAPQSSTAPMGVGQMHIKPGIKIMLSLDTPVNTATARIDDELWFTVRDDVKVGGLVALPRGTPIRGKVIAVRPAVVNGKNQRTELQIRLLGIPAAEDGRVDLATNLLKVKGEKAGSGTASTAQTAVGSAAQGAALGGMIAGSAKGAGIGAIAGLGVGILGSTLQSRGPTSDIDLPSGSVFEARLAKPLDIPDPILLAKAVPRTAPAAPNSAPSSPGDAATAVSVSNTGPADSPAVSPATAPREVPEFDTLPANEGAPASASTASPDSRNKPGGNGGTSPVAVLTPTSLSVDVNLIQVDAVVHDRTGKPMGNLRQEDFRVLEDGVEQRIQFFSRDALPLAIALVVDRSGSVAPLMGTVQAAAYQALQLLKAGDEVCLFTFAGDVEMLEELTPDRQRVANRIGGIRAGGGTAIVDAVSEALRYLDTAAHDRRRAVILISDNIEGRSGTPVGQAIESALESEAVVYSVKVGAGAGGGGNILGLPGIPGMSRLPGLGSADPVREITRETGGEIFDATGGASIATALTTAVDRLKLRYTLSYASEKSGSARAGKGGYHRIQVQLVGRFGKADTDYTIHSRSGYYDPPARTNFAEVRP